MYNFKLFKRHSDDNILLVGKRTNKYLFDKRKYEIYLTGSD